MAAVSDRRLFEINNFGGQRPRYRSKERFFHTFFAAGYMTALCAGAGGPNTQ
jgi:hypothetical protein